MTVFRQKISTLKDKALLNCGRMRVMDIDRKGSKSNRGNATKTRNSLKNIVLRNRLNGNYGERIERKG